ncbi:MAG: hypothetical protein KBD62_16050 [Kofleriaceae bacterium]|nr:hypothetical protein [Kofleriaceae bacterium]
MNLRVLARRTRDSATVWIWDWFASFMLLVLAIVVFVLLRGQQHLGWWMLPAAAACLVTRRLSVSREDPVTGQAWTFWFVIPVQRQSFAIRDLVASHSDDWAADARDARDELRAGSWSLVCRDASSVATWLRDRSAELATPRASVSSAPKLKEP